MYRERKGFGGGSRGFSPVSVGQELDVKIEAVGEKGDGIAKEKGFVLFVPGVKQGDEVRIKVTKVLRNVGFAEVVGNAKEGAKGNKESSEKGEESYDSSDSEEESETGEEIEGSEESNELSEEDENSDFESKDSENFGEEDTQQ